MDINKITKYIESRDSVALLLVGLLGLLMTSLASDTTISELDERKFYYLMWGMIAYIGSRKRCD